MHSQIDRHCQFFAHCQTTHIHKVWIKVNERSVIECYRDFCYFTQCIQFTVLFEPQTTFKITLLIDTLLLLPALLIEYPS